MAGTETVNIAPGRVVIQVKGLRELSRALSDFADKEVPRTFAREMKAIGGQLAEAAQAHAFTFSRTGAFASSIGVVGGRSGISLRSTDPGAGALEFAHAGATVVVPAHTRDGHKVRAYTRKANLPGSPPRALFAAINDELPKIEPQIADVVERMLAAVLAEHATK